MLCRAFTGDNFLFFEDFPLELFFSFAFYNFFNFLEWAFLWDKLLLLEIDKFYFLIF